MHAASARGGMHAAQANDVTDVLHAVASDQRRTPVPCAGQVTTGPWKRRQVSGQLAAAEAAESETPIWQPATLPRVSGIAPL